MKIAILGNNGYIGTALHKHLEKSGHEVVGVDNFMRKLNVSMVGGNSVTEKEERTHESIDITEYARVKDFFRQEKPDAIVHLAEQPSAPFSMSSAQRAGRTQKNNIIGTLNVLWAIKEVCPDAHLVKLGTEGEYPDWLWDGKHIPEGNRMDVFTSGKRKGEVRNLQDDFQPLDRWTIPTPRYAGSWYHFSKLHDSMNIDYACKIWGLTATDVNQGIVYGHRNGTRLDVDEMFGTVVHRFVAQAVVGKPLTVYGTGGQTRGFICLQNSIEAIELLIENPPEKGDFRVIHQTTNEYTVKEIAEEVQKLTDCEIDYVDNPRAEMKENSFTFDTSTLENLGLETVGLQYELPKLVSLMEKNKDRIPVDVLAPKTQWL